MGGLMAIIERREGVDRAFMIYFYDFAPSMATCSTSINSCYYFCIAPIFSLLTILSLFIETDPSQASMGFTPSRSKIYQASSDGNLSIVGKTCRFLT